jgi:hypothetical protein
MSPQDMAKALDPKWPIREADMANVCKMTTHFGHAAQTADGYNLVPNW